MKLVSDAAYSCVHKPATLVMTAQCDTTKQPQIKGNTADKAWFLKSAWETGGVCATGPKLSAGDSEAPSRPERGNSTADKAACADDGLLLAPCTIPHGRHFLS